MPKKAATSPITEKARHFDIHPTFSISIPCHDFGWYVLSPTWLMKTHDGSQSQA